MTQRLPIRPQLGTVPSSLNTASLWPKPLDVKGSFTTPTIASLDCKSGVSHLSVPRAVLCPFCYTVHLQQGSSYCYSNSNPSSVNSSPEVNQAYPSVLKATSGNRYRTSHPFIDGGVEDQGDEVTCLKWISGEVNVLPSIWAPGSFRLVSCAWHLL